jgi:hypothetical protein
MSAQGLDCRHVRVQVGGDPHTLAPDVAAHLVSCADCRRFQEETLALDARVRAALELPVERFRRRVPPARRFALAASVMLALFAGGGFWLLRPQSALAGEVADHVRHEAGSWNQSTQIPPADVASMLAAAGVKFVTSHPVVYAMTCPFHGRRVPHLVVQTAEGPMTVMLLANESISARKEFSEGDLQGVLLPAGGGTVAVLTRGGAMPGATASEIVRGVSWR